MDFKEYEQQAKELYAKPPSTDMLYGQKFTIGDKVKIVKGNSWFAKEKIGEKATIEYSYSQKYGGKDINSYCLNFSNEGTSSWYDTDELELCK